MTALAVVGNKQMVAEWGERQLALIRRTVAKDCNNDEFDLFINMCRSLHLDPLRKQIYAFVYNKDKPDKRQLTIVTAISGFRTIAERTGNYRPDEEGPTYVFDDHHKSPTNPIGLVSAKVRVYKFSHGAWHPVTETAFWDEAAPIKDEWAWDNESGKRKPTGRQTLDTSGQWGKMPRLMLAKVAEAAALRKAWPDELSNIYGEEEVDRQKFIDLAPSEIVEESVKQDRLERVGHIKNSVPMNWNGTPDEPIEFVPIGQFYDRCVAHIRDHGEEKSELMLWWQRNAVGRKEAWALAPTDYNAVKQEYEAAVAAEPAEA
jgi:phage recombination protein Bet